MINESKFCLLSTSSKFHGWLQSNHEDLYFELIEHLKSSNSCYKNQLKMSELLNKIKQLKNGMLGLIDFLNHNHYECLNKYDESELLKIFESDIVTFPRRKIIDKSSFDEFIIGKINIRFHQIGNKLLIEYLLAGEEKLLPKIKDKWALNKI